MNPQRLVRTVLERKRQGRTASEIGKANRYKNPTASHAGAQVSWLSLSMAGF